MNMRSLLLNTISYIVKSHRNSTSAYDIITFIQFFNYNFLRNIVVSSKFIDRTLKIICFKFLLPCIFVTKRPYNDIQVS